MNLETQRIDKGERKTRGIHQFHKVVVANRGDVARRVIRALRTLGIRSVAVYSEADAGAPYLAEADEAYLIGEAQAQASYLNQDALLKVIKDTGADGVHPGYGFLSENTEFAARVESAGVRFIGPSPQWIDAMSHKSQARELMAKERYAIGSGIGHLVMIKRKSSRKAVILDSQCWSNPLVEAAELACFRLMTRKNCLKWWKGPVPWRFDRFQTIKFT